jgi:hypothetical protein
MIRQTIHTCLWITGKKEINPNIKRRLISETIALWPGFFVTP